MKVISYKDPVIINGKKINDPSEYLSADGMKIIRTNHPLIVNGKKLSRKSDYLSANGDDFYGANGSSDFYDADGFSVDDFALAPDFVGKKYGIGGSGDEYYNSEGEQYSYIDKNNKDEVRAFQAFVNSKGYKPALDVDGIYGPLSDAAYKIYGASWEATRTSTVAPVPVVAVTSNVPAIPVGGQPTASQIEEQKKKGVFWDKAKRVWVTAKDSGLIDLLSKWLGWKPSSTTSAPSGSVATPPPTEGRKMSKGLRTGLIIGGVVVLGLVIYAFAKKK
jgi:hypothetical protein